MLVLLNQRNDMTSADCEDPFVGSAAESQPLNKSSQQGQAHTNVSRPTSAGVKQPLPSSKQDVDLRVVLGDPELSAPKDRKLRCRLTGCYYALKAALAVSEAPRTLTRYGIQALDKQLSQKAVWTGQGRECRRNHHTTEHQQRLNPPSIEVS